MKFVLIAISIVLISCAVESTGRRVASEVFVDRDWQLDDVEEFWEYFQLPAYTSVITPADFSRSLTKYQRGAFLWLLEQEGTHWLK